MVIKNKDHFPVTFAVRCDCVTKFWSVNCKQKQYVQLAGSVHKGKGPVLPIPFLFSAGLNGIIMAKTAAASQDHEMTSGNGSNTQDGEAE